MDGTRHAGVALNPAVANVHAQQQQKQHSEPRPPTSKLSLTKRRLGASPAAASATAAAPSDHQGDHTRGARGTGGGQLGLELGSGAVCEHEASVQERGPKSRRLDVPAPGGVLGETHDEVSSPGSTSSEP